MFLIRNAYKQVLRIFSVLFFASFDVWQKCIVQNKLTAYKPIKKL